MKAVAKLLALLTVVGFIATSPATAQEFPASQEASAPSQIPADIRAKMQPGIRYTVGSTKVSGWHHDLVKSNHNLGNYFWADMSSMKQATVSEKTKRQAQQVLAKKRENYHYIKPVHVANPRNPNVHLPSKRAIARRLPETSVNATLSRNMSDVNGQLISQDTAAKVYADYGANSNYACGVLSSKDAYGKLLND
ncbi:MAG: hypothetical protein K8F91_17895 [Candidatus Obscuribacterales bacterium]|nr:hypothetical protein [Candidatus Obscuribacterales bacterium]